MECFTGEIRLFAGNYAPEKWHFCDGSLLTVSGNEALYSLIGTTFGGDGRMNFRLPDLRGRVPVGQGNGLGLTPRYLGQAGGTETANANLPSHRHTLNAATDPASTNAPSNSVGFSQMNDGSWFYAMTDGEPAPVDVEMNGDVISVNGNDKAHNNMMGTMALSYIICMKGQYPVRP